MRQEIPSGYTIHRVGVGSLGQEMGSAGAGSSGQEYLPFRFDRTKEVQSLSVPNHLVRLARFLTKSVLRQMFTIIGLEGKGPDHHLKLAHDLICKVILIQFCFVTIIFPSMSSDLLCCRFSSWLKRGPIGSGR